jgi:hypothetical protein
MRTALRGMVLGVCLWAVSGLALAATPRTPGSARGRERRGRTARLVLVNFDLQGKTPASEMEIARLRSLLMYLSPEMPPDLVALHSVGRKFSAGGRNAPLAKLASSLGMYYAFQSTTDALGSAVLSHFPIKGSAPLSGASGPTVGMKATIQARPQALTVLLTRPPAATADQAAIEAVTREMASNPKAALVVFASFSPGAHAASALTAWTKAGLEDAAGAVKQAALATYPSSKPADRLDFILISPALQGQVASYRVTRDRRLTAVSDHLPVAVVLRR